LREIYAGNTGIEAAIEELQEQTARQPPSTNGQPGATIDRWAELTADVVHIQPIHQLDRGVVRSFQLPVLYPDRTDNL